MTITDDIQKQYWTIGEVADILGVAESCVRYWCKEFGVGKYRSKTNHRRFTIQDIVKLQAVQFLLHSEGHTIEGCKSKLNLIKWPLPAARWEEALRVQLARIVAP